MTRLKQIRLIEHFDKPAVASAANLVNVDAADQMAEDYLAYAACVNLGRAIPSAVDGLKPVQRRVLYAMSDLGLSYDKPFRKCARVEGEVMGRLHPHSGAYPSLVNLANDWANRYVLVDGHGNFGTTSDGPAAARYTECRLKQFAQSVLLDHTDSDWISYKETYDAAWVEPSVLAARLPMLLLRDTAGIGVAAACRHVSYNISQVAELAKAALYGKLSSAEGLKYVSQPDFAMGGLILPSDGMRSAITNGSGSFYLRAKLELEQDGKTIVATELPQDVSPERVLEQTFGLIKDETISRRLLLDARDESDLSGTRVVWELRDASQAAAFVQLLWRKTDCQICVSVNAVSVDASGKSYSCKGVAEVANVWAESRKAYEQKRLTHELLRLTNRAEVLDGLLIALAHIQQVAQALIDGKDLAELVLTDEVRLSSTQTAAIEAMPLRSLRAKNRQKLEAELKDCESEAAWRRSVLAKESALVKHIAKDVAVLAKQFGDEIRTKIYAETELDKAALVATVEPIKHMGWIYDCRLKGNQNTFYRASNCKQKALAPIEVTADFGVAVLMSDGGMYWLPASAMPIDAKTETKIESLLRQHLGKAAPDLHYVALWAEPVDRSKLGELKASDLSQLWLLGHSYGKQNCVAKRLDLAEALALFGSRRKQVWTGVVPQLVLTKLPDDDCVTAKLADGSSMAVCLSSLGNISVGALGRQLAKQFATGWAEGNTTGKRRGIVKPS